jgi:hypothetical protein
MTASRIVLLAVLNAVLPALAYDKLSDTPLWEGTVPGYLYGFR